MKKTKLNLYADISGNDIGVNQYHYGKGKKSLYIQGGVHGGELTYFIFAELDRWLRENETKLKKTVTLVPIINPTAWNQRVYYYTVGKFDLYKGKDWNRSYPGKDTTLSARNSAKVFEYMKDYEFCLDLHTARLSKPYTIFTKKKLVPYVRAFGLKNNYYLDETDPKNSIYKGTFNYALDEVGVPSLTCECGSHDSYDRQSIDEVTRSIKNLTLELGITEGDKLIPKTEQNLINKVDVIFSPTSGFVVYHVGPQEYFKKGQLLCTIHDSSDLSKQHQIKAENEGMMFELAKSNIGWIGDELMRVVYKKNIESL